MQITVDVPEKAERDKLECFVGTPQLGGTDMTWRCVVDLAVLAIGGFGVLGICIGLALGAGNVVMRCFGL